MATNIFKFLTDYVAVYTAKDNISSEAETATSYKAEKMSYKDFYTMLQEINENANVSSPIIEQGDTEFHEEHIEKYELLMEKLNYKRLPLNLKQYSLDGEELILTLQFGGSNQYFMDRVFDSELGFKKVPLDKASVYIVVISVGFTKRINESSIPRPNKLSCLSVHRKNITIVNKKSKIDLEEISYLQNKLTEYLDENINTKKGSKIKVVKDTLLDKKLDVESILRYVTEEELKNIKFTTRMHKSIAERKPIDWKGLTYK